MFRRSFALLAALLALAAGVACSKKKPSPRAPAKPHVGWSESGVASWYGHPYHGRKAANGETYDMDRLTAAHRTLPFGAVVEVENRDNGRKVEVRITDRGPFIDGRVIDLSRAAAQAIEMIGPGTARVRLRLLGYGPPREVTGESAEAAGFSVQAGAFASRDNAEALKEKLQRKFSPVRILEREGSRTPWRVIVGKKRTEEEASVLVQELKESFGLEAFMLRAEGQVDTQK